MKIKLSILLMSFAMTNFVNAEYMAKIPLEQNRGGSLPDNSIIIGSGVSGNQPVVTDPAESN